MDRGKHCGSGHGHGRGCGRYEASRKLVSERFLLQEDADRYIQAANERTIASNSK